MIAQTHIHLNAYGIISARNFDVLDVFFVGFGFWGVGGGETLLTTLNLYIDRPFRIKFINLICTHSQATEPYPIYIYLCHLLATTRWRCSIYLEWLLCHFLSVWSFIVSIQHFIDIGRKANLVMSFSIFSFAILYICINIMYIKVDHLYYRDPTFFFLADEIEISDISSR